MDPNVAFDNILRGLRISEHVLALGEWLAGQGFTPYERTVPDECALFVAQHCARHYPHNERTSIRVRADRAGIWTAPPEGPWISLGIWVDLLRMD